MANFVYDTFTTASDTPIGSHTPEVGSSWTAFGGGATVVASTGFANPATGSGDSGGINTAVAPSADYTAAVTIGALLNGSATPQVYARATLSGSSISNCYFLFKPGSPADNLVLAKKVGGSYSPIGSNIAKALSPGDELALKVVGSTITVMVNGVTLATATDTSVSAPGMAGFGGVGGGIDSFRAYTTSLGVAPDNGTQSQSATSPSLIAHVQTAPDAAAQAQVATSPSLSTSGSLSPSAANQTQVATSPTLAFKATLAIDSASQAQAATVAGLGSGAALTPNAASQIQAATQPALTGRYTTAPANALQAQAATTATLGTSSMTVPASAVQVQSATSPALFARTTLLPDSAYQAQYATSGIVPFIVNVTVNNTPVAFDPAVGFRVVFSPGGRLTVGSPGHRIAVRVNGVAVN